MHLPGFPALKNAGKAKRVTDSIYPGWNKYMTYSREMKKYLYQKANTVTPYTESLSDSEVGNVATSLDGSFSYQVPAPATHQRASGITSP